MSDLALFINTSNNTLVAGQTSTQPIDPLLLPFFYGDTINLAIYFLTPPSGYNPQNIANNSLASVVTAGLAPFVYLTDGTIAGNSSPYASQLIFTADPTNTFWNGALSLNTAALSTLIGTSTGKNAYLKIGVTVNGLPVTKLSALIKVGVGIPIGSVTVPANLTPLSLEVAQAMFFPLQPVAGLPLYLESVAGKIRMLAVIDQADGTAPLTDSAVN